ncbi:Uncharacterized protein OBRU01_18191, partial [Operophtera brumata]
MDPAMAIEVAAMSQSRAVEEATVRGDSDIQKFYRNSTVFITGGSGFMGKQMIEKLFRSFVHVSTAYSCAIPSLIKKEVYERFYKSPIPPETLISMAEDMDVDSLIQDWPNTYTFTKAVAEELFSEYTSELTNFTFPVISSYREPSPGWLDVLLGIMLGVLHVSQSNSDTRIGLVPCDYVNNTIISAGKEASHSLGGERTSIYVVSSVMRNHITQASDAYCNVARIGRNDKKNSRIKIKGTLTSLLNGLRNMVSPKAIYYNFSVETSNKSVFLILSWLIHLIPAYVVDFVFVKIAKKVYNISIALSYFTLNHWLFVDENLEGLHKSLSETDKIIFNFDLTNIDWTEYIPIWVIGTRKYLLKDGLKGTEYAIRKQYWLKMLHYVVSIVFLYCLWKLLS